ncbi:hypothetical protein Avbf_08889 [Armadillidium vulgare]|nr:hypothetical protein Avbf_08889 [Armadillidium vulgare]
MKYFGIFVFITFVVALLVTKSAAVKYPPVSQVKFYLIYLNNYNNYDYSLCPLAENYQVPCDKIDNPNKVCVSDSDCVGTQMLFRWLF